MPMLASRPVFIHRRSQEAIAMEKLIPLGVLVAFIILQIVLPRLGVKT